VAASEPASPAMSGIAPSCIGGATLVECRNMVMFFKRPKPEPAGPGQESVWDYPRPPRIERTAKRVIVRFDGRTLAESSRCMRVLETSHPPVYYIPMEDVDESMLRESDGATNCEFKGAATYFDVTTGERTANRAAFTYRRPTPGMERITGMLAIYAGSVDEVTVDGEPAKPQEGGFYAGWITDDLAGPFKGGPGTMGW